MYVFNTVHGASHWYVAVGYTVQFRVSGFGLAAGRAVCMRDTSLSVMHPDGKTNDNAGTNISCKTIQHDHERNGSLTGNSSTQTL